MKIGFWTSAAWTVSAVFLLFSLPCSGDGIDSGGGSHKVGTFTNHSSIGSPIATNVTSVGTLTNRPGLIEVLYPSVLVDSDGDGMSDEWEDANGLIVGVDDSQGDDDSDNSSNVLEFLTGTNPQDPLSAFRPLGTFAGSLYNLQVPTVSRRTYRISISRNLVDWLPFGNLTGDDTTQTWTFDEEAVPEGPFQSVEHPSTYFFQIEITIP